MATSSLSLPFSQLPLILAAFQSAGHVGVCAFVWWLLNESSKWRGKPLESQVKLFLTHTHIHINTHINTHKYTFIHNNVKPPASKMIHFLFTYYSVFLVHSLFVLLFCLTVYSAVAALYPLFSLFHNHSAWFSATTRLHENTHILCTATLCEYVLQSKHKQCVLEFFPRANGQWS